MRKDADDDSGPGTRDPGPGTRKYCKYQLEVLLLQYYSSTRVLLEQYWQYQQEQLVVSNTLEEQSESMSYSRVCILARVLASIHSVLIMPLKDHIYKKHTCLYYVQYQLCIVCIVLYYEQQLVVLLKLEYELVVCILCIHYYAYYQLRIHHVRVYSK